MDFRAYEATPGISVILLPDAPVYTCVAVSNDFIRTSGMKREAVIGVGHFSTFPKSPDDPNFTGEQNLKASFEHIIQKKEPHEIPVQRYDIPNGDGTFTYKYWKINNVPILDDAGEVLYIVHSANDITDLIKAEQAEKALKGVEKQNEELLFVMNFMPQMVWQTLPDGTADFFNQVYLDYTGLSIDKLTGHQWINLIHPDDVEQTHKVWSQALAYGNPYTAEYRLRGKDGTYRWFLTRATAMKDATGAIIKWYGTTTDVQEHKQLYEAHVHQNMLFRTMTDNATSTLFMMDKGGFCTFMNVAGEKMFGYSQKEIREKPLHYIIHHHRPDGSYYPMSECPIDRALPENFDVRAHRDLFFRKDGFSFPVSCAASPIFENGIPVSTIIEVKDITLEIEAEQALYRSAAELEKLVQERTLELEEQKSLLNNILTNSSNGISVTEMIRDEKGSVINARTILANDAAVKFIGIPKDVYLSITATELDPNILSSPYGLTCIKTLETGEPSLIQYYLERAQKWLELTISKMDADHLIHIFTDVTPIKESQLRLEQTVAELQHSNQNLEEFAHAASHDLKEPVRKVQLFSNMLKRSFPLLDAEQERLFERVEDATQRMSQLIEDLLEYSHVSMGVDLQELIDLNGKVEQVIKDLEVPIQETGANITVENLPAIKGQRRQFQQLFHNLIQNSLKYSKKDIPPQITISSEYITGNDAAFNLAEAERNRSFHLVTIKDNGIGFEQEYAKQIFQMFKRLHGKSEYSGSGVGLAIVKKVVENHKGYIWAESNPGDGATFKILLPAV